MSRGRRAACRILPAAMLVLASMAPGASVVMAASPSAAAPSATVRFLDSIIFRSGAIMTSDVLRVEIVVDLEGSTRSIVADVPTTAISGSTTLSYILETPGGSILPNTDVSAYFRMTLRDGSSVSGPATTVRYQDDRFRWQTLTGEFMTVHWVDGGQAFGRRALRIGDEAVREVSDLLGVTEREPIDFYVYGDREAFYDVIGPGSRENLGGLAPPGLRTLFANIGADAVDDPWVGIVIPHELTHLVFDSAVTNPYHYPPRWLNEGVAVYLSEGLSSEDRLAVRDAARAGSIMPLHALVAQLPTTEERFRLAYSESVSAVSFLVDRYGRDAMVALVRSYADGVSDDEAFEAALGTDVAGFEAAWLESIGARVPTAIGPQPAPAGPVPADWGGPAQTPGTAERSQVPGDSGLGSPQPIPTGDDSAGFEATGALIVSVVVIVAAFAIYRQTRRASVVAGGGSPRPPDAIVPDEQGQPPEAIVPPDHEAPA